MPHIWVLWTLRVTFRCLTKRPFLFEPAIAIRTGTDCLRPKGSMQLHSVHLLHGPERGYHIIAPGSHSIYISIYVYISIYIYVYKYTCIRTYVHASVCMSTNVYMYIYIDICLSLHGVRCQNLWGLRICYEATWGVFGS